MQPRASWWSSGRILVRLMPKLSHLNEAGEANMVDVSDKTVTAREATAEAMVVLSDATYELIQGGEIGKGDVLSVARVAAIQAAKRTSELIPLCHPLAISKVGVDFEFVPSQGIRIESMVRVSGKTGVEMEALTAASVAALTIYDMCKAVQRDIVIEGIKLLTKSGGKSGTWTSS